MSGRIRQTRIAKYGRRSAKGQTLAIVALVLGLGVLIGLVAVAFDGGSALLQRRAMQNGADAGSQAGIDYMSERILITCAGNKCRPSYGITNAQLRARVEQFVAANRGGTIGTPVYTTRIEYHYMFDDRAGTPPSGPCSDCYIDAPVNNNVMPEFIDGLRVTAIINNPTTFAGAIPNPISDIRVSAVAASRIFSTCAPPINPQNATVPFTRFRPALEDQIYSANGQNTYCTPFKFWQSQGDLGGGERRFQNVVSFNTRSFIDGINPTISNPRMCGGETRSGSQQLLSDFDCRYGVAGAGGVPPQPPEGGLVSHSTANGWSPFEAFDPTRYRVCNLEPCADLRGSRDLGGVNMQTDIENWLLWRWRGRLNTSSIYDPSSTDASRMTRYPAEASQQSDFGRNPSRVTQTRSGDWAETLSGNLGQNINDSLTDAAAFFGTNTEYSPPAAQGGLGWGKALKTTIYVWGNPQTAGMNCVGGFTYCDDKSLQETDSYTRPLPPPGGGIETVIGWKDVLVRGASGSYQAVSPGQYRDMRVRFTHAYTVVFYQNLQGSCNGCINLPACTTGLVTGNGSEAVGFIINERVSDPPPGVFCTGGWQAGGGVYTRQIEP